MKCQACQFDDEAGQEELQPWERKREFVEIRGHFTKISDEGGWHQQQVEVSIYACPKCGTLKTDAV